MACCYVSNLFFLVSPFFIFFSSLENMCLGNGKNLFFDKKFKFSSLFRSPVNYISHIIRVSCLLMKQFRIVIIYSAEGWINEMYTKTLANPQFFTKAIQITDILLLNRSEENEYIRLFEVRDPNRRFPNLIMQQRKHVEINQDLIKSIN